MTTFSDENIISIGELIKKKYENWESIRQIESVPF